MGHVRLALCSPLREPERRVLTSRPFVGPLSRAQHDVLAANAAGIHVFCCTCRCPLPLRAPALTKVAFAPHAPPTGNHSATERPWLSYFAPRLERTMNELAGGAETYEVVVSEADKEPLQVV